MSKKAQLIRKCYFPISAIPDTFTQFKKLYSNYLMYSEFSGKEKDNEMKKDFEKLNPNAGQNRKSNKRTKKSD